jgi:hypothetical protein
MYNDLKPLLMFCRGTGQLSNLVILDLIKLTKILPAYLKKHRLKYLKFKKLNDVLLVAEKSEDSRFGFDGK